MMFQGPVVFGLRRYKGFSFHGSSAPTKPAQDTMAARTMLIIGIFLSTEILVKAGFRETTIESVPGPRR